MGRPTTLLCLAVALAGCSSEPPPREYQLTGQILALTPDRPEVTIRHEDIENFMPAMTMSFPVEDRSLLDGKRPGDLVTATLVVGEVGFHLAALTTTGHEPIEEGSTGDAPPAVREGDPVADVTFEDQDGQPRTLASLRGHRVAVTFVYTRCPLPEFCPLMNRNFAAVQKAVRSTPDLRDVRLLTVTLDPAFDRPPVLKTQATAYRADPAIWSFVTGDPAELGAFATQFGIISEGVGDNSAEIIHNLRTVVIGPDGRLVKNRSGNDWTPADLIADLSSAPSPAH
jgi:protein SCO1/2